MNTNLLSNEKSPYLLQHAHNPVQWYPWGKEAFEKARKEDKPIFLSIGYSTCHWCHVMERESFESEEIAAILNRHFVAVKVDREERPDIDRIYMTFVQATTGGGGWPMSVWLTPDLKPFYGGTYFPPDNRYGRPGFATLLEYLANAWISDRARIVQAGEDVVRQLSQMIEARSPGAFVDDRVVESCFLTFRRSFDTKLGGFGSAPKFPRPVQFHFLLRYWLETKNEEALEMTLVTLREMYRGGMYDQLAGGFHRYSVDARWFVPHFEKMLYDQAQLVCSYLEAYQITGEAEYAQVARETLDYVLREMTDGGGGFYSAEDADSVIEAANPRVKGEGAFFIWTAGEIDEVLGSPASEWFRYRFGVEADGNVTEDPHGEFTGRNILYQANSTEETARHFGVEEEQVERALAEARSKLMERRSTRIRPHLDDKVLTAWNGLMISAFARAAQTLGDQGYLIAAQNAAAFLRGKLYQADSGLLLRRYRDGEAGIDGFLDDYAFLVEGLLDLYEADFDIAHLDWALNLTETMRSRFEDPDCGGFFSTAAGGTDLVLRIKDDYDGAEPSANSVAILNLFRLGRLTGNQEFTGSAELALRFFAGRLQAAAVSLPRMVAAYQSSRKKPRQIVLAGPPDSPVLAAMLTEVRKRFLPGTMTIRLGNDGQHERLARWMPMVDAMQPQAGQVTAYICEDYSCKLPVTSVEEFRKLLE
jgi:hypothetical protein